MNVVLDVLLERDRLVDLRLTEDAGDAERQQPRGEAHEHAPQQQTANQQLAFGAQWQGKPSMCRESWTSSWM